jgi:glycosyltransferase involved in cell wall biosynthesis
MSKRDFTLILPYYENPEQLQRQYKTFGALPDDVRNHLDLIVVDDGSPDHPAIAPDGPVVRTFRLFRIDVDVRWNWLAARNIGVHHARTDWVLLTDIDLELPEVTARRVQEQKLSTDNVYRFGRLTAPELTPYKPHPNSWMMTRKMFDRIGGYDERFSGFYGTDGEFRDRVRANAARVIILEEFPLIRVPRELVPDASTTRYGRKEKQDHDGVTRIRAQIAREGGKPKRLSFPYHQVA